MAKLWREQGLALPARGLRDQSDPPYRTAAPVSPGLLSFRVDAIFWNAIDVRFNLQILDRQPKSERNGCAEGEEGKRRDHAHAMGLLRL